MISTDGTRLFVADSASQDDPAKGTGRIFATSPEGGSTLDSLAGAEGLSPRGMELVSENGADVLYFTGVDPEDDQAAVYKMSTQGTNLVQIVKGEPLVSPSGITVDKKGVIYVADAAGEKGGTVYKIVNGAISELAGDLAFGHPAGMALVPSESYVLVSGIEKTMRTSTVYKIEIATGQVGSFNDGIGTERNSAGLHRAHNAAVYTWAAADGRARGESFTGGGTVYLLKGK
jgi:DNA-binding beta-propeller fold protein YncE